MTTTPKSKSQSLSARRSSPPRTRSKSTPEPKPSPPRTHTKALPKPYSSPVVPNVILQSPFSLGAITPIRTLKTIALSDWWLTRKGKEKKKKGLCITGFESSTGGSEVRLFSSGTIVKRHNSTTLESVDGITICISGFINRSRSQENGVSDEVCNRFLLGFPFNWEDYNEERGESGVDDRGFVVSFDDVPVSRIQDLSYVEGCLKNKILDDVVGILRDLVSSVEGESLVCPKSDEEKSLVVVDDGESLVSSVVVVVGVKTRAMRRREDYESSIGKRVCTMSRK